MSTIVNYDTKGKKTVPNCDDTNLNNDFKYKTLFANNILGVAVCDYSFSFGEVNQAFCDLVGYTREELLHMNVRDISDAQDHERLNELFTKFQNREIEKISVERTYIDKNGRELSCDTSITATFSEDGKFCSAIAILNDVTKRKRASELQERYMKIFENSHDSIFIIDPVADLIVDANPSACEMLEYSEEEIRRTSISQVHPDEMPEMISFTNSVLQKGKGWTNELTCKTKSGYCLPAEIAASPIEMDGKQYVLAIVRNITERKEAEKRLREQKAIVEDHNLQLKASHNEIKKLNSILESKFNELNAVNKELEAFSYSVSHDLRAPLRSIYGFSQALKEDYTDILDEEGHDYLNRIVRASSRMGHLIDDLLKLSRITRSNFKKEEINLSHIAKDIINRFRDVESERKVIVNIEEDMMASGDERLMTIALENLLGNAWKYSSKSELAKIDFGRNSDCDNAFYISDNGAGFDMKFADKLFDAFQRLHGKTDYEGTGIGLATVKRIIKRHDGDIWAEGEVDKGAKFHFTLSS